MFVKVREKLLAGYLIYAKSIGYAYLMSFNSFLFD